MCEVSFSLIYIHVQAYHGVKCPTKNENNQEQYAYCANNLLSALLNAIVTNTDMPQY